MGDTVQTPNILKEGEPRPVRSATFSKLAAALVKAQSAMGTVPKRGKGTYGPYATLDDTWEAIRKPLSDAGISIYQRILQKTDGKLFMATMVLHESGEFFDDCELEMKSESNNRMNAMQALGSAVTYARRYTLQAVTGVAPGDDDDGVGAGDPGKNKGGEKSQNQQQHKPKDPPPAKSRPIPKDPAQFVMPIGEGTKGKKLGEIDEATLRKILSWTDGELVKKREAKDSKAIAMLVEVQVEVKAMLKKFEPQPPPDDSPPPSPEDQPFPEEEQQHHAPVEHESQEPRTRGGMKKQEPDDYVITFGEHAGKKIKDIGESDMKKLYLWTQDQMKVTPPVNGIAEIVVAAGQLKAFLTSVGAWPLNHAPKGGRHE